MATATRTRKATETNGNSEAPKTQTNRGPKKIHQMVNEAGGIVKINLGQLRDELGHARIGKKVLSLMADHLTENNLGVMPAWVMDAESNPEPRQWQEVWVYERDGSAKSAVLDAVSDPDNHDIVAALNMFSEGTPDFASMDDAQRLAFVRAAVCQ